MLAVGRAFWATVELETIENYEEMGVKRGRTPLFHQFG
jgi:hypothetical protein